MKKAFSRNSLHTASTRQSKDGRTSSSTSRKYATEEDNGEGDEYSLDIQEDKLLEIMEDTTLTLQQRERITEEMNSRISRKVKHLVEIAKERHKRSEMDADYSTSLRSSLMETNYSSRSKADEEEVAAAMAVATEKEKQQQKHQDDQITSDTATENAERAQEQGHDGTGEQQTGRSETEDEMNMKRIRTGYLTGETNYDYGSVERMSAIADYRQKLSDFAKARMGVLIEQVTFKLPDPPFRIPIGWILSLLGWRAELAKKHVPEKFRPSRKKFLKILWNESVKTLFLDLYWFVFCHIFQSDSQYAQEVLLQSVGKSHVKIHSMLNEKNPKMLDMLPFVLSNGVFLGFWYGMPGSRAHFDAPFKLRIAMIVTRILTGMELATISVMNKMEECFPDDLPRPPPVYRRRNSMDSVASTQKKELQRRSSVSSAMRRPSVDFAPKPPPVNDPDLYFLPADQIDFPVKYTTEEERELLGYRDSFRVELLRSLPEELVIPASNQAAALTYVLEKSGNVATKRSKNRSPQKRVNADSDEECKRLSQSSLGPLSLSSSPGLSPKGSPSETFKELHGSRKHFGPFGSGNRGGGGGKHDKAEDVDENDKFNVQADTLQGNAMRLLKQRSKGKVLSTSFSLTDTGALVQRTLPPGKSLSGGRSFSVSRYIPVPWGNVGDLATVKTQKPRTEVAQNVYESQQTIKRKRIQTKKTFDERCVEFRDDQKAIARQVLFDRTVSKGDISKTALDIQLRKSRDQNQNLKEKQRKKRLNKAADKSTSQGNVYTLDAEERLLEYEDDEQNVGGKKSAQVSRDDPLRPYLDTLPQPDDLLTSQLSGQKSVSTTDLSQPSYRIVNGKLRKLAPKESEEERQQKEQKMMRQLREIACGLPSLRVTSHEEENINSKSMASLT